VHTGECELDGEKVRGIAVHTGARVASLARPGEVLVSSTVRDLVAGSGIEFEDRGTHELKGVPGEWRLLLYRARAHVRFRRVNRADAFRRDQAAAEEVTSRDICRAIPDLRAFAELAALGGIVAAA
jgi:hypothetical protein